ncbi:transglutaminase TgpA family protein [Halorarius halobius]|uniref:transglutaminase TgpA family protein n=1 Tax=Halorarius halobius TaxID=2962671 RepID=UPI0020CED071|nr:transglutaminaseTgpA domain-containing protein [Halorarius halobius]
MSTTTRRLPVLGEVDVPRLLAVGSVALVVLSYLSILHFIATVAGKPTLLLGAVGVSVAAATLAARVLRPRYAAVLALALVAAGTYYYLGTLPEGVEVYGAVGPLVSDSISLLSGLSILRIVNAGTWALAIAPGPTFLAWYLALRRHYVAGAAVAGFTLGIFVLTGNADAPTTLLGAVGVVGAMGFGDVANREHAASQSAGDGAAEGIDDARRAILVELGAVVVGTSLVNIVPGRVGARGGNPLGGIGGGSNTVEGNLLGAADSVQIQGSISLSPEVRFTVDSGQRGYWRIGSYDRYTGRGWVRTGESEPYESRLASPRGRSRRVEQTYEFESRMGNMPALWKPVEIEEADTAADVLPDGSIRPVRPFAAGESYTVESRTPVASPRQLREAGTDYPTAVEQRYTALPENIPRRVADRTSRITGNATNPYDTARVIEQWLENNRAYSLDVEKPGGTIADAFLFEMRAGYCTYFATTMVTMLRTQGVPARFVVGYTPGEQVARTEWVVRGLNAHAWVEVFFPDHGWIRFDPTPGGARNATEQNRLSEARENNETNVDTERTGPEEWTPTPDPDEETATTPDDTDVRTPNIDQPLSPVGGDSPTPPGLGGGGFTPSDPGGASGFELPTLPSREQVGLGLVVAGAAVAGLRRSGLTTRAYREVWLRYQPRTDPVSDTRRAFERVEYVLERDHRPREPGETVRQYAADVGDERARRVAELYERATYAGGVTEAEAGEAVSLADELVADGGLAVVNRGAKSR